jgi:nitrogen regulatory protein PII
MKKIEAIIRLSRFDKVRDALADIGLDFFTLSEVKGFGLQREEKLLYRGNAYESDYIARLRLDIICEDDKVETVIQAIMLAGRTGEIGDGKIAVYDIERVLRIRTGEEGAEAI